MRRSLLISCLLIVAVSGCGQQAKAPAVIAIVDGQKVLQVDYQQQRKDFIAQARNSGFAGAGLEESDCAEKSAQANKKQSEQKLQQGCGRFLKSLPAQAAAGGASAYEAAPGDDCHVCHLPIRSASSLRTVRLRVV